MLRTIQALSVPPIEPLLSSTSVETERFLDLVGPVRNQQILIVGPGALETLCALNARGAVSVISVQTGCRPRMEPVDAVVAPNIFCLDTAEIAILRVRKSGRPACRLYLRFASGEGAPLVRQTRACLVKHRFHAIRSHWLRDRVVLAADRPRDAG